MTMMEEEGGTGGPTTTTPEGDGVEDGGGDGGGPDPAVEGGAMRRDLERAEIQGEGMSSGEEGLSSDGERGGEEYYDESFDGIGAEAAMGDGEFGGGPWSGEGPYAYGGGGY